jgi:hypothetical protein
MPRKRKPARRMKRDHLTPLPVERPWYHAPLRMAANSVAGLFGLFRSRKKISRAARRRRKI